MPLPKKQSFFLKAVYKNKKCFSKQREENKMKKSLVLAMAMALGVGNGSRRNCFRLCS